MPLTATQICKLARDRAKATGYTQASGQHLNLTLQEICLLGDYEVAKAAFNFTTTGATAPIGNLQASLASGPFQLPPDYVRAKKGDIVVYWASGFPQLLTPIDLEEFDKLVMTAGFQNIPIYWVTDTSLRRDAVSTWGNTTTGSGTLNIAVSGMSSPGTLNGIAVGMGVYGDAIAPGKLTTVTAVNSGAGTVTVSPAANVIATYTDPAVSSLIFAVCPIAYVWAPSSGAYPILCRYFRKMPDIITPESSQQIPWFEWQDFLIDEVSGRLLKDTGNPEWKDYLDGHLGNRLKRYLAIKDDTTNRARSITMDRRRFGSGFNALPKSKVTGY